MNDRRGGRSPQRRESVRAGRHRSACARRCVGGNPQGRVLHAARPLGLRQDHAPAPDRGVRDADLRSNPAGRQGYHRRSAEQAPRQHGVPELCAVPASDGGAEHRLRTGDAGTAQGGGRRDGAADAGAGAAGEVGGSQDEPAVGRPAAARGAGPGAGAAAEGAAAGRAAVGTGPAAAQGNADRTEAAAA